LECATQEDKIETLSGSYNLPREMNFLISDKLIKRKKEKSDLIEIID